MALKPELRQPRNQRISLTPALRRSLSILRMPAGALMDHLASEAKSNPLLVLSAPPAPAGDRIGETRPHLPRKSGERRGARSDLVVRIVGRRGLAVSLAQEAMPRLVLDTALIRRLQGKPDEKHHVEDHAVHARQLIDAVSFRNKTLLRIAKAIVAHQHRFFLDGSDYLAPLTRTVIARKLALHPSTVGRAIANKTLRINGAVYPLMFFMSAAIDKTRHKRLSAYFVQLMISRLVEHEQPNQPLSDDAIVRKLRADGVDIARRTVAKYRGCMNIPSSFKRRHLRVATRTRPGLSGHNPAGCNSLGSGKPACN